jgi:hypothetical protein
MASTGAPPAAWQGPEDSKRNQPTANSPNRLTHRNPDNPRIPDIDLSETKDQRAALTPVAKRTEQPEVSAEDVDEVPAPSVPDGSERPKLPFLKGLFQ